MANNFLGIKIEDWLPPSPLVGPPLPRFIGITWPWYKPAPVVTIHLKNPPSEANYWQMSVIDWDFTKSLSWEGKFTSSIGDPAIFEIPADWSFPLRVNLGIYYHWYENDEKHGRQLYSVQSHRPNSDYKEIFIAEYGSYYFNVATEEFEKI